MRCSVNRFRTAALAALVAATVGAFAACDRDPAQPNVTFPTAQIASDTARLGRQAGIRVVFPGGLLAQTALDQANFVVTNLCNGLRIPGSLRVAGDTLIFSPSQALPYLTRVGVRIQNLQAANGTSLAVPITATFVTEPPPVSDVSWALLNSPTNDLVTGIDFAQTSVTTGFALSSGGGLYRTNDGGRTFQAIYKDINVSSTTGLYEFGTDTVYFTGAQSTSTGYAFKVFRSVNGGVTVDSASNGVQPNFVSAQFARLGTVMRGVITAAYDIPFVYSFRGTGGGVSNLRVASGIDANPDYFVNDAALSADTTKSVVAATDYSGAYPVGVAYRSVDGAQSYARIALPANTFGLNGAGFIDNTTALLVGDSSGVYRVSATTGAVTKLGAAQGIPQTVQNTTTGEIITYSFLRARFDPAGKVGYVVGQFTRQRPGAPDQFGGIVLQTSDGGQTFTRQGITGAADNGLGFQVVVDVKVKSSGLAVLSGLNGLVAARQPGAPTQVAVCSLTQP